MLLVLLRMLPLFILIGLLGYFFYKGVLLPALSNAEEKEAARKVAFDEAKRTASYVKKSWLDYELGNEAVYDLPSMVDMKVPEVAAFNREMAYFNEKYPNFDSMKSSSLLTSEFILDAKRLNDKFEKAERRARSIESA